jgi:hypothetical protein
MSTSMTPEQALAEFARDKLGARSQLVDLLGELDGYGPSIFEGDQPQGDEHRPWFSSSETARTT